MLGKTQEDIVKPMISTQGILQGYALSKSARITARMF